MADGIDGGVAAKLGDAYYDTFVIIDLEATCDEDDNPKFERDEYEIIEFPWVVLSRTADGMDWEVTQQEQLYVQPVHTFVTEFCTSLTGITQEKLDTNGAVTLGEAMDRLDAVMNSFPDPSRVGIVTHGTWDLGLQLPREAQSKGLVLQNYLRCYFNLRDEYLTWKTNTAAGRAAPHGNTSLTTMCQAIGVPLEGSLHCGLDDCLSIANVARALLNSVPDLVFQRPIDRAADLALFNEEGSTVVFVDGLPFQVDEDEVLAWFNTTSGGAVPRAVEGWMVVNGDSRPSGCGYVNFAEHAHAAAALTLNGRLMGSRLIEVQPCPASIFATISPSMLAKFAGRRDGDWDCPSCGYMNFASRTACRECSAIREGFEGQVNAAGTTGYDNGMAGGRPGDWACPACDFHNFASRFVCRDCGGPRPGDAGGSVPANPNPNMRPGDWSCFQCGFHNFASRYVCRDCGAAKFAGNRGGGSGGGLAAGRPGDWNCVTCGFHNFASRSNCRDCNTPKMGYGPGGGGRGGFGSGRPGDWNCPDCNFHNFASRSDCRECNTPKPENATFTGGNGGSGGGGGRGGGWGMGRPGDWNCSGCNFHNFASRSVCRECGNERGENDGAAYGAVGSGGSNFNRRDGDWDCDDCGFHNFASRTNCRECGIAGGNGGGGGGGGGGGDGYVDRRDGDWDCASCGYVNFASRTNCNDCGAVRL